MKIPFIVHCGECQHEWAAFYVPCNFTRVAELLKNATCSVCRAGAYNVFCGPAPVDANNTSSERVKKTGDPNMRYSCRAVVGHGQKCEPNYQCDACAAKQKYIPRIEKLEAALREIKTLFANEDAWSVPHSIARKALEGKDGT